MQALKAVVKNGRLVLDEPTKLPEGTEVELLSFDETVYVLSIWGGPRRCRATFGPKRHTESSAVLRMKRMLMIRMPSPQRGPARSNIARSTTNLAFQRRPSSLTLEHD